MPRSSSVIISIPYVKTHCPIPGPASRAMREHRGKENYTGAPEPTGVLRRGAFFFDTCAFLNILPFFLFISAIGLGGKAGAVETAVSLEHRCPGVPVFHYSPSVIPPFAYDGWTPKRRTKLSNLVGGLLLFPTRTHDGYVRRNDRPPPRVERRDRGEERQLWSHRVARATLRSFGRVSGNGLSGGAEYPRGQGDLLV